MLLPESSYAQALMFTTLTLAAIILVRLFVTKKYLLYLFLFWNMLLAIVPVIMTPLFAHLQSKASGWQLLLGMCTLGLIWLLFLPNTFYLLTDIMHLNQDVLVTERDNKFVPTFHYVRGDTWYILEGFMLILLALFGALTGGYALNGLYEFLNVHYSYLALPLMTFVLLASAFGVYIGRFGRWNSWDVITRPVIILKDSMMIFISKKERMRIGVICLTIIIYELFSWGLVRILQG